MEHPTESEFYVGDQHVAPERCAILTADGELRVEPRVMDVLVLMVRNAGQVVSREEFIKSVWSGTFVTDEVLSRCIYRLRQALGDDTRKPRFIETVSKRGYRLIAPVRESTTTTMMEAASEPAEPSQETVPQRLLISEHEHHNRTRRHYFYWTLPAAAICLSIVIYMSHFAGGPKKVANAHNVGAGNATFTYQQTQETRNSIVVLPFVNISDSPANDYFCDGISEELIGLLSKVQPLKVVARTSSFEFKDKRMDVRRIAEQLGVNNVLEGSVRLADNHIRVSAQLIDARTGYHIWSDTFDAQLEDVFKVQSQIAGAIVSALRVSLDADDSVAGIADRVAPTTNMTAYRYYLQGLYLLKRRGDTAIRKSIDLFKDAVSSDPEFAPPYQALSTAYLVLPFYSRESRKDAFAQAEVAARRALELDPSLGQAHAVLAYINLRRWDWKAADREFRLALAATPNDPTTHQWYSEFLSYVGYIDSSLTEAIRARELDPVSPVINDRLGVAYLWAGQYELAAEQFRIATELGFNRIALDQAYVLLLLHNGHIDEAISLYEKILGHLGLNPDWVRSVMESTRDSGEMPRAIKAVAQGKAHGTIPDAIVFYAAVLIKQPNLAFDAVGGLLEDRSLTVEFLFSPEAEDLRRDPRFSTLLTKIGLDVYWRQYGWPTLCKPHSATVICS